MKKIIITSMIMAMVLLGSVINLCASDIATDTILFMYKHKKGETIVVNLNRYDYSELFKENDDSKISSLSVNSYSYYSYISPWELYGKINVRRTNEGLISFSYNNNLGNAAYLHSVDMMTNNYCSHTSLDGRTYEDRIIESGYNPWICDEAIGILTFNNFIEKDIAENIFVDYLFMYDHDVVSNPNLKDIGIGFIAGTYNGRNAYIVTYSFGTDYYPEYINIGSAYSSGINNSVEFWGMNGAQCMHGYATCRGWWWINPCNWTSSCATGWEYNPADYYYESNCNCF